MTPAMDNKSTAKQVQGLYAQWLAGYDARDTDKVMSVFDPELRFTTRGAPDQDFAALKENYAREFNSGNPPVTWKKIAEEIYADNAFTTVVSQWQWNVKPSPAEPVPEGRIRCVDVLRLSAHGFRIVRTVIYRDVA